MKLVDRNDKTTSNCTGQGKYKAFDFSLHINLNRLINWNVIEFENGSIKRITQRVDEELAHRDSNEEINNRCFTGYQRVKPKNAPQ